MIDFIRLVDVLRGGILLYIIYKKVDLIMLVSLVKWNKFIYDCVYFYFVYFYIWVIVSLLLIVFWIIGIWEN